MKAGLVQEWVQNTEPYSTICPRCGGSPRQTIKKRKRQRAVDDEGDSGLEHGGRGDFYPTPRDLGSSGTSFSEKGAPVHRQHIRKRRQQEAESNAPNTSIVPMQDTDQTPRQTRPMARSQQSFGTQSQSSSSAVSSDRSSAKRSRRSGHSSPSKRAVLRSLQSSIDFRILRDTSVVPVVDVLNIATLVDRVRGFEAHEAVVPECEEVCCLILHLSCRLD